MELDTIYFNGEIHTFDAEENVYEAVSVQNGKIVAVGSNEKVLSLKSPETTLMDLNGKTVLPGFIDAHIHLFNLGFNLSYVDCRLGSIEAIVELVEERAKQTKNEDEWIIGWGFDEGDFLEKRKPNKWDFDHVKNPVYITRYCLHEAVVNETAIRKARITKETTIEGGLIERTDSGEPTGIVIEKAKSLLEKVLPPYTHENMKEAMQLANDYLLKYGITSAHDAGLGFLIDPEKEFDVLKEMSEEGTLQVKTYVMVLAEYYKHFLEKYHNQASSKLKIGSLKLFADGTLSGKTAALFEPYKNTNVRGMLHYTDAQLKKHMETAYSLNKQVAIHAIGDRAIDQVLRTIETLQREYPDYNLRPRIEHTTVSNENLRKRMKEVNAIPVIQPTLIYAAGDTYQLDKARLDHVFATKSFMDHNLKPAASSDSPVTDCSPFLGISSLMTRETVNGSFIGKSQKIDLKTAVKLYTLNAAYAAHEENEKGSIEPGKYADFVVLPNNFINFSAKEVKETKVEMTIIDGEIVYKKR